MSSSTTYSRRPVSREPRFGWVRPLSVRVMVVGILALGAIALLVPTFMRYLDQRAQLTSLRAQVATAKATNEDLTNALSRWDDDSYVVAQARERLSYVFPGETAYKVIDPQTVVDTDTNPQTGQAVEDGAVTFSISQKDNTWYGTLWDSVEVAGASS